MAGYRYSNDAERPRLFEEISSFYEGDMTIAEGDIIAAAVRRVLQRIGQRAPLRSNLKIQVERVGRPFPCLTSVEIGPAGGKDIPVPRFVGDKSVGKRTLAGSRRSHPG